jgi:hypothetical protein
MLQAVLVWVGLVLAFGMLLLMAVGPAVVELDAWLYERKHRRHVRASAEARRTAREQAAHRMAVSH